MRCFGCVVCLLCWIFGQVGCFLLVDVGVFVGILVYLCLLLCFGLFWSILGLFVLVWFGVFGCFLLICWVWWVVAILAHYNRFDVV